MPSPAVFPRITCQIHVFCLNTCLQFASGKTKPRHFTHYSQPHLLPPDWVTFPEDTYLFSPAGSAFLSPHTSLLTLYYYYYYHLQDWGLTVNWSLVYWTLNICHLWVSSTLLHLSQWQKSSTSARTLEAACIMCLVQSQLQSQVFILSLL